MEDRTCCTISKLHYIVHHALFYLALKSEVEHDFRTEKIAGYVLGQQQHNCRIIAVHLGLNTVTTLITVNIT